MIAQRIAVIGAGAWGTALANVIARAGRTVTLFARDPALAGLIATRRESPRLPGVKLDERVAVAALAADKVAGDAILVVVPAQTLRAAVSELAGTLAAGTPVVACAKGIERGTRRFMTEIIAECLPAAVPAILSGPSFASDVARGLPTAVTLAASDEATATMLAHSLGSATFRPYHSTDVRSVEIGGAAKNVLAIAAGIVAGRKLGASAAAALTTLSGLGDLILTCSSAQSRNFQLGRRLGEGSSLAEIGRTGELAEGVYTAGVLVEMARERAVETPVADAVVAVLDGTLGIDEAIEALMTRPFRAEV
jgi:glycerol-3-phosphate dehydrogenase (NAD(P)+)